jgi:hypothetical protein
LEGDVLEFSGRWDTGSLDNHPALESDRRMKVGIMSDECVCMRVQ